MGKGTLINDIKRIFPHLIRTSISHTTRLPRKGERNGIDYYFTSTDEMEEMIRRGLFLEYDRLYNAIYGTSFRTLDEIRSFGCVPIIEVSIHGMQHILQCNKLHCNYLYIVPPTIDSLEKRLKARHTESDTMIKIRMKNVENDMIYGYKNSDYIIVNEDRQLAVDNFEMLLLHLYPSLLADTSPDCDLSCKYNTLSQECFVKFSDYFTRVTNVPPKKKQISIYI